MMHDGSMLENPAFGDADVRKFPHTTYYPCISHRLPPPPCIFGGVCLQANDNGMAQVGVWHQEMADAYSTSLKERGLIAETHPVD